MPFGQDLKALSTFKAGNGFFFYRLAGFLSHFRAVQLHRSFAFGHRTDAHRHLLNKGRDFLFSHDPYTGLRTGYFQRFF